MEPKKPFSLANTATITPVAFDGRALDVTIQLSEQQRAAAIGLSSTPGSDGGACHINVATGGLY